jgi:NAD(P)-dependent dehydrogenase (short-subunit alcohol dehydrogenase family)
MNTAVLTGGTSGLGRFVARGLVQAGWRLVLVARDAAKVAALRAWIAQSVPDARIELELADLALLAEVRRAAAAITARHPAIGLLVLNAGAFQARRVLTAEGHEMTLAVNHLSPFVMIGALAPALPAGGARVVVVGSDSADDASINPDDLELRRGWGLVTAYPRSKLALLTTSLEWARRLAPEVSVNVVHPGFVATDLVRATGAVGWAWRKLGRFALTPEQGAAVPLRAAIDPALAGVTGRYIKAGGFASPNRRATDPAMAARVWQATERLVGVDQPARQHQRADASETGGDRNTVAAEP